MIFDHDVLSLLNLPDGYRERVKIQEGTLNYFEGVGVLLREHIYGKEILDWEGGDCSLSVALLNAGALSITAIDSFYSNGSIPTLLNKSGIMAAHKTDIANFLSDDRNVERFDLVFSNTVTEHVQDLPSAFYHIFRSLKPGGYFFSNHGNYYDPVGSHDHGFMFYGNGGVEFLGPRCWETSDKCDTSKAYRTEIYTKYGWTITEDFERRLTPANCTLCPYFKRAQPWAHLLYQAEFSQLFDMPAFTTGREGSCLNKITSFQLRQFLREAGFEIVREHREIVSNDPPPELLTAPFCFAEIELKTSLHRYLARKPDFNGGAADPGAGGSERGEKERLRAELARTIAERDALAAEVARWSDAALALGPRLRTPPPRGHRWWWRGLGRLEGAYRRLSPQARADRARDAGKWELAVRYYREALDRDRGDAEIWAQWGHALTQAGKTSEAELAYQRSRELRR